MANPTGCVIVNLGTPAAPTPQAIRRYLKEFLSDRLVVDRPPKPIWFFILRLFILPRRPKVIAPQYASVWLAEGAPLTVHTRNQRDGLQQELGEDFRVEFAMRYGSPSIADALRVMTQAGIDRIVVLPMFPQYSRSTTGSVEAKLRRLLKRWPNPPRISVVPPFFASPGYIEALAAQVGNQMRDAKPDHLLISFHGIPQRFADNLLDPYRRHCELTAQALVAALRLREDQWTLGYQSRFGKEPWLEPEVAALLRTMPASYKRLLVVCPGFPADCLETTDEIGALGRESFIEHGGESLTLVEGLNAHPEWIKAMASLVREADPDAPTKSEEPDQSLRA